LRSLANEGNFTQFSQGLPRNVSNADAKKVYNEVRRGMGLKEQKEYFNKLHFEPVSEKREAYVKGNLFNIGDHVTVVGSDELASVTSLGTNYVIIESNGKLYRKWLTDVELVEKMTNRQDPDIRKEPGSQPAGYYAGVDKKLKKRRMAHFKKYAEKPGDGPDKQSNYKPAPGDKGAKTKLSKHTIKYRKMYGEDAVDVAKQKIAREKMVDKMKHARMLNRAKIRKLKNRSAQNA
jgi:hypothetical protein